MKKIKNFFLLIVVIIISAFFIRYISTENNNIQDITQVSNTSTNSNTSNSIESPYLSNQFIKAYVSRIVDGDTIEIIIDSKKYKVRFIGVNCPEYTSKIEYYGKESFEYTTNILKDKYIFLEKDVSETDKYGRLLRYVWLEIPTSNSIDEIKSKMFNSMLLNNGYARAVKYIPDIKYYNTFKEIANIAENDNIRLWNK